MAGAAGAEEEGVGCCSPAARRAPPSKVPPLAKREAAASKAACTAGGWGTAGNAQLSGYNIALIILLYVLIVYSCNIIVTYYPYYVRDVQAQSKEELSYTDIADSWRP